MKLKELWNCEIINLSEIVKIFDDANAISVSTSRIKGLIEKLKAIASKNLSLQLLLYWYMVGDKILYQTDPRRCSDD